MGTPENVESLHVIGRRDALRYGAVAGTAVIGASVGLTGRAHADESDGVLPAPTPIPGGIEPQLHVFAPGPRHITLPFSGVQLQGLDVEPSVFTDYAGFSALAFHVGTATGSDGKQYNLETDMRAYRGRYIAADGTTRRGVFGFV